MAFRTISARVVRAVIAALAASWAVLFGASAWAQYQVHTGVSAQQIANVIRNNGVSASVVPDSRGKPFVAAQFQNGLKFAVFFYRCESDNTGCERYQYVMNYTRANNVPYEQVNSFNGEWIFGKISHNTTDLRRMTVFFPNVVRGGVTSENINSTFRLWGGVVRSFMEHFTITAYGPTLMSSLEVEEGEAAELTTLVDADNAAALWTAAYEGAEESEPSKIMNNYDLPAN